MEVSMKKVFVIMLFISCFLMAVSASADVIGNARLSLIRGDVAVQTADSGNEWIAASINLPLTPGDKVWVPEEGRAEIQILGETYLRVDGKTDVEITNLNRESSAAITQIALPQGRIYTKYRKLGVGSSVFQVDTPIVSAMAYESARFELNVDENGYTEVSVIDGFVYVESNYGNTKVNAGYMLSIGPDSYADISPRRPRDEWLIWNMSRDALLARSGSSSRYLPPALGVYSGDFDEYGRWVNTSNYGYVWTPRLVAKTWAPYRSGRWVWMNGDYVWISYEPWGWAPYHYGRWAFSAGVGWCWVPPAINAVFWAPGFVAWINTPTYISWVPLAPGEIYYGYGHYGPHSVNLRTVNITTINVTNVYFNSRVAHGVTVIHRDTFLTGRPVRNVNVPVNPFSGGARVSPGRPDVKPVRETIMPHPTKVIPPRSLPAMRITDRAKTTGITNRPVAVHEKSSVFRSGTSAPPMRVNKSAYPKPATKIRKAETDKPQTRKGDIDKPAVRSSEGSAATPVKRKETSGPETKKGIIESPGVKSKEAVRPSVKQKEAGSSKLQKGVTVKPVLTPKGTEEKQRPREKELKSSPLQSRSKQPAIINQRHPGTITETENLQPPQGAGIPVRNK
jgi:hypothetical protein